VGANGSRQVVHHCCQAQRVCTAKRCQRPARKARAMGQQGQSQADPAVPLNLLGSTSFPWDARAQPAT